MFKPAFVQGRLRNTLTEDHQTLLNVISKHKEALSEIEDATLNFLRKAIAENPPVYIARTRDKKTDIEYFVAKTFLPLKGGKKKEVKVYVGKASDYGNDTKNEEAKFKGYNLLRTALRKKIDEEIM